MLANVFGGQCISYKVVDYTECFSSLGSDNQEVVAGPIIFLKTCSFYFLFNYSLFSNLSVVIMVDTGDISKSIAIGSQLSKEV